MKLFFKIFMLLLWMSIIFFFSSQTGSESSETSEFVVNLLQFLGIDIDSFLGQFGGLLIRKGAHMFEYFILCLLFFNLLKDYIKHSYFLSVLFSFMYACTDEIHQYFVPNRGPSFLDVLIDSFGAILAIVFIVLMKKLNKVRKIRR